MRLFWRDKPAAPFEHRAMQLEEIESRILHSADLTPIAFGDLVGQVEMRIIDTAPAVLETKSQQTTTNEVVFVDAATPDYRQLIDDIAARANGERDLQVVLIENDSDGIHKISDVLSGLQNIDAIHIISHGSDGNVRLGATVLDAAALRERGAEIQAWASSLTQNADILLYGCDVAQQADGRSLVDNLASLTGADVAASDDITGAATRGGNWVLEYQTGSIEAAAAISIAAQQSWQGTLANSAPVLTGANNAAPINEDAVSNGGTLVSALITSPNRTSDADVGALQGIAVTSVGNTNGVWEYSIDNRSTWNAFGAPTLASARLLTADAVTYVRFVPNADWNGTVTNGLTFRAWDQTSGVAGATADTTTASLTVADNFTAPIYANNDGTATWAGNWVGGGGNIVITGGQLVISTALLASDTIDRGVDLSGATSATLSFSYNNQLGLLGLLGSVTVEASTNGTSYTTLATFSSLANTGSGVHSVDISSYMSSTTRVRFALNGIAAGGLLNVDNLQISFVTPLNGGATAFSSATASSSITVNPINDAPVGTSNTVTTNEDTPFVFNAAAFGFSDPSDTPTNNLLAVRITTLPSAGSLTLSGVAVSAGQSVSAVNIAAGNLLFTPAANANGAGYASFTFQVQDDGGTTNGGVDLDAVARTLTINVTPVNDAPIGASNTVVTNEDTPFAFNAAAFGFSDPTDTPANSLLAVKIGTLPSAGSLTLSGAAVSAGQSVSAVDIAAGNLVFAPAANANGAGYAGFTFQVQDDGGTANGGVDLDAVARTMTINVTAVNDAPIGTSNTVVTNEDTPFVFSTASFGFTDPTDAPANSLLAVKITGLPVAGALTLTGFGSVTAGQVISAADITAGKLVFTPATNANGAGYASFNFQVQDDGGTANGGVDLDTVARTLTINVTAVNDAPVGTNNTVVTNEDTPFVFNAAAFGFADPIDTPANSLLAVKISTLPSAGALTLSGAAVSAGQSISAVDIAAGNLVFTPVANANGAGYSSFNFQVQDDGGTANGGVDLDTVARTLTINVTAVNDAPVGTNNTVVTNEDTPFVFNAAAFGFTDPIDAPANTLLTVKISALPTVGALTLSGVAVSAGQSISAVDIAAGNLVFTPVANANGAGYSSFAFQVQDNGGTANGGVDLDTVARTLTINVTAVNDAPVGTNNTVVTNEDTPFVFNAAAFGFTDPIDAPANTLLAVEISALPTAGALTLSGVAASAGQSISAVDIAAGNLVFMPSTNANGAGYSNFTFQVQDDGGTANGGVDLDAVVRTMTINVTAVNDAPVGTSNTVVTNEDTSFVFNAAAFGFTDPSDAPANNLLAVKITSLPSAGLLSWSGAPVSAGQVISTIDIAAGKVLFTPAPDANGAGYASFTFQVQDDGGTANGGVDLDAVARTMIINVNAVNDAPVLVANNGLTLNQGTTAVITNAMLQTTDIDNTASQLLFNVTAAPSHGRLELITAPGIAVTTFSQSDIDSNRLVYIHDDSFAPSDAFAFTVSDGAGGAIGTAAFPIDISAVNHAPSNQVPGAQTIAQATTLVFSTAQGNAIIISDPDAGPNTVQVTISARDGWLSLANKEGLGFSVGTGTQDATVTFTGTLASINAALDGMVFMPTPNYSGQTAIAVSTDDLGSTGAGGHLVARNTVTINVTAETVTAITAVPASGANPGVPTILGVGPQTDDLTAPPMPVTVLAAHAAPMLPIPIASAEPNVDLVAVGSTSEFAGAGFSRATLSSIEPQPASREYRYLLTAFMPDVSPLVFATGETPDGELVLASADGPALRYQRGEPLGDQALLDALDDMRASLHEEDRYAASTILATAAVAMGLSVGYVIWLLRGGVLLSSLLSSLPAWRLVDPLPIVGRIDDDAETDESADDSLEAIVARNNVLRGRSAAEAAKPNTSTTGRL